MKYDDLAGRLSDTFVADIPGTTAIHRTLSTLSDWADSLTSDTEWIEYRGAKLYADTSDHVAEHVATRGGYEPAVSEQIDRHLGSGDRAVDVGAHVGHHTLAMRQCVGASGEVWAFEPNPKNADYLGETIRENGWTNVDLFPVALSDTESDDRLIVPESSNTGSAALLDANAYTGGSPDDEYTVETRRLTSILEERAADRIDLLKIDVEGAETDIVADLSGHLQQIETILLEFHTQKIDDDDVRRTFELLDDEGRLTDLDGDPVGLDRLRREKVDLVWQSEQ